VHCTEGNQLRVEQDGHEKIGAARRTRLILPLDNRGHIEVGPRNVLLVGNSPTKGGSLESAAVFHTHGALAPVFACEMPETDKKARSIAVVSRSDQVEQLRLIVVEESPRGVSANVSQLDHRSQLAVDEHWGFYDAGDF
jgi:hypothetical protein